MACRLPGGVDRPEHLWELLLQGRDAIVDVPSDRWDSRVFHSSDTALPGKCVTFQGGFLRRSYEEFDAKFFGITSREAEGLDPQQRLILEVAWEVLEDGGQNPDQLRGSATGVFVGGFCMDNQLQRLSSGSRHLIDAFTATSSSLTLLSNRISHFFDFCGPSISIDTACSSSLVGLHLACQSLWGKESNLALAGGVNLILRPEFAIAMSKGRFLSSHNRCRAFDDGASGYVRGEGVGVVLLKRLSDAREAGDRVHALILATGVNQDGGTPSITQPNSEAQSLLIHQTCDRAGVLPGTIAYVEAHGTGTQAGDIAELKSLDCVLRPGRPQDQPCWVGALKTNIGHLEAAAGVAALIKTILVLRHQKVPQNLHFQNPNKQIDFSRLCLRFPQCLETLDPIFGRRLASVNAFGYGGTNAHAILEAPPDLSGSALDSVVFAPSKQEYLLPISAQNSEALRVLAEMHARRLDDAMGSPLFHSYLSTASHRRAHLGHRLVVRGETPDSLKRALQSFQSGQPSPSCIFGEVRSRGLKPVYIFSGMGSQWMGMGQQLRQEEPVFREAYDQALDAFKFYTEWNLRALLENAQGPSATLTSDVAQGALFALQYSLTVLWRYWGVLPSAVIGHSAGEVAAACAAGALKLADAVRVCATRALLQQRLAGSGAMLAVNLDETTASRRIVDFPEISLAASNSPHAVTLVGSLAELQAFNDSLPDGIFRKFMQTDIPYHGRKMDSIKDDVLISLHSIRPQAPATPIIPTSLPPTESAPVFDAEYWWANIRNPVRFREAVEWAATSLDSSLFLEVGPHPVLSGYIHECFATLGRSCETVPSLRRDTEEFRFMRSSAARLHSQGVSLDWQRLSPAIFQPIDLPFYPWQRTRYWNESLTCKFDRLGSDAHPLFQRPLRTPTPMWESELNRLLFPAVWDHRLGEHVVFPGAGYVDAGLVVGSEQSLSWPLTILNMRFENILKESSSEVTILVTQFLPQTGEFSVHSRNVEDSSKWTRHASGYLSSFYDPESQPRTISDLTLIQSRCQQTLSISAIYAKLKSIGLNYGPLFQVIQVGGFSAEEGWAKLARPDGQAIIKWEKLHPALLDGAFQLLAWVAGHSTGSIPFIPTRIGRITVFASPDADCMATVRILATSARKLKATIQLWAMNGELILEAEDVECRPLALSSVGSEMLYEPVWKLAVGDKTTPPALVEVIGGEAAFTRALSDCFAGAGIQFDRPVAVAANSASCVIRMVKSGSSNSVEDVFEEGIGLLEFIRARTWSEGGRLMLVTNRSLPLPEDRPPLSRSELSWWGLASLIENEFPGTTCQIVDLDLSDPSSAARNLFQELFLSNSDRAIAWRGSNRYSRRFRRFIPNQPESALNIRPDGAYLITGGTSGFGLEIARWLASEGAGAITLISRRGEAAPELQSVLPRLRAWGASVEVLSLDVTDEASLEKLFVLLESRSVPLKGIFHCSMVLEDGFIRDLDRTSFKRVWEPKARAAFTLDRLSRGFCLDYFVCISSVSSMVGNPGQAAYIAANSILDGLAHHRRAEGLPALTINLGLLGDTGVVKSRADIHSTLSAVGMSTLSRSDAIEGLAKALRLNLPQVGLFRMDWNRWQSAFLSSSTDSRWEIDTLAQTSEQASVNHFSTWLRSRPVGDRPQLLLFELTDGLAQFLKTDPIHISPETPLSRLGIDSLSVVEVIIHVKRHLGIELSPTDLLGNATLNHVVQSVLARMNLRTAIAGEESSQSSS